VLGALGIEVRHALPGVGANLQDHYQLWVQHGVKGHATLGKDGEFPRVVWSVLRYAFAKTGPLSFPAANVGAFVPDANGGRPIFQIHFTPGAGTMDEDGNMVSSKEPGVNSTVCTIRPTSRGHVHARSKDPKDAPKVLHNYLSTEEDQKHARRGLQAHAAQSSRRTRSPSTPPRAHPG